jgi:DNA-directed RNA polymerase specialized sigma24 family protein
MIPFSETSWTLLARARQQCEDGAREREEFAQRYYRPVREFLVVLLRDAEQAQDMAQEFFARIGLPEDYWSVRTLKRGLGAST